MTHTLNNSMAGFVPECNISFNGGDLSSDTGAILPLDFINSNSLLQPYADLPFLDERQSCKGKNSNFSLMSQQVFKYLLGYSSQADQKVLAKDPVLCQYFQGISSQSSVSRLFSRVCEDTNNLVLRFINFYINETLHYQDLCTLYEGLMVMLSFENKYKSHWDKSLAQYF